MTGSKANPIVSIWLDPCCPWAWQTAQWLEEVVRLRANPVAWRVMCLALLPANEPRVRANEPYMRSSLRLGRLLIGVEQELGRAAAHRLYLALGRRIHPGGYRLNGGEVSELIESALTDADMESELISLADSSKYQSQLEQSTGEALELAGDQVGTPVIAVGDVAFFGPVISRVPRGQAALDMFDGALRLASFDGFYELKRSRYERPQFDS